MLNISLGFMSISPPGQSKCFVSSMNVNSYSISTGYNSQTLSSNTHRATLREPIYIYIHQWKTHMLNIFALSTQVLTFYLVYAFTQPHCHVQDVTQGQFLSGVHKFEFRVFLLDQSPNQGWKSNVTDNLPLPGSETDEFMLFPRALTQNEMQAVFFKIGTRVANSIS